MIRILTKAIALGLLEGLGGWSFFHLAFWLDDLLYPEAFLFSPISIPLGIGMVLFGIFLGALVTALMFEFWSNRLVIWLGVSATVIYLIFQIIDGENLSDEIVLAVVIGICTLLGLKIGWVLRSKWSKRRIDLAEEASSE